MHVVTEALDLSTAGDELLGGASISGESFAIITEEAQ
jgi:hypothetical protein